jgi:hypothetical protein
VAGWAAVLAALAFFAHQEWGVRERSVIFYLDRIEAPHGLPGRAAPARLPFGVHDIGNIEACASPIGIVPLLYTRSAEAHCLGLGLNEFEARKAVVDLITAQHELLEPLITPEQSDEPERPRVIV